MEDVETSDILPGKTKKQRIDMNKQQRLMKSIVDKSITNMARSFQALVETTVIGNSSMQGNLAQDEEQGDGVGVENQEFSVCIFDFLSSEQTALSKNNRTFCQDLYTGLMKHKFQSAGIQFECLFLLSRREFCCFLFSSCTQHGGVFAGANVVD